MRATAILLAVLATISAGCVGLSPEDTALRTHYRIHLEPGPMGRIRSDRTLGMRPFTESGSLAREGIRHQTSDVEGGYFSTHLWSEPVATMVQTAVYADLDTSGLFERVLLLENVGSADFLLDAEVHRFEEVDDVGVWTGLAEITFEVTASATGEVVLHRRLTARENAAEPTVKETVRALSRALGTILGELRIALAEGIAAVR